MGSLVLYPFQGLSSSSETPHSGLCPRYRFGPNCRSGLSPFTTTPVTSDLPTILNGERPHCDGSIVGSPCLWNIVVVIDGATIEGEVGFLPENWHWGCNPRGRTQPCSLKGYYLSWIKGIVTLSILPVYRRSINGIIL